MDGIEGPCSPDRAISILVYALGPTVRTDGKGILDTQTICSPYIPILKITFTSRDSSKSIWWNLAFPKRQKNLGRIVILWLKTTTQ